MGYKDDLDAAHARIRALEQELASSRGPAPAPDTADERQRPRPRPRGGALVLLALPLLALLAVIVRQPLAWMMLALVGVTLLMIVGALRFLFVVARPSELWAIVGTRGVRLVTGRAVLRIPILEQASSLDASAMLIERTVRGIHCHGGELVEVRWYLLASVSRHETVARSAVERFLGRERSEIERVAAETAEGHLRAMFAELRPEEADRDPFKVAARISAELEEDFAKLGLDAHGCGILELRRAP